jgi:hypothetical protein
LKKCSIAERWEVEIDSGNRSDGVGDAVQIHMTVACACNSERPDKFEWRSVDRLSKQPRSQRRAHAGTYFDRHPTASHARA